jgi:phenylpropionate dioxygenase-like ring-hydroxylating dioxygenase large terminal subunit
MATAKDSEILTRVGPSTPMGELMRQYWIPAAMSRELRSDDPPMRLILLGERLIAFRDSSGKIGVMDHRCPHRCASLFYGRNENGGIRCVYHGFKYDVDGNCLDMPNVPAQYDYKNKIKAKAYKTLERNGLIWVYMGPRTEPPDLPMLEPTLLREDQVVMFFSQRDCNWLQALEGDIDTSHLGFLHWGSVNADDLPEENIARYALANRRPELKVTTTDFGTMYGAWRQAEGKIYWRFSPFAFPFWTMPPEGHFSQHLITRAWVPLDDYHTMMVNLAWKGNAPRSRALKNGKLPAGFEDRPEQGSSAARSIDFLPNTTDWFGRWRLRQNASNDYEIDREVQHTKSFTGIPGIHAQDQAITESMGPIVDHEFEHLGHGDQMIIQTRRRLVQAALALQNDGKVPPAVDHPELYLKAYAGDLVTDEQRDAFDLYATYPRTWVDLNGRVRTPASEMSNGQRTQVSK